METIKKYENNGEEWETVTVRLPKKQADLVRRMSFKSYVSTNNIIRLAVRQFVEPELRKMSYH